MFDLVAYLLNIALQGPGARDSRTPPLNRLVRRLHYAFGTGQQLNG